MFDGSTIEKRRAAAIHKAAKLGFMLKSKIPGIANWYREGFFIREIEEEFGIETDYNVSPSVAKQAVRYAIVGFPGGFKVAAYTGLISDKIELNQLLTEHKLRNSKETGQRVVQEKIGIHGKSLEQRAAYSSIAGKVGGAVSRDKGVGIHSYGLKERVKNAHKSHIARGLMPWSDKEAISLQEMVQSTASVSSSWKERSSLIAQGLNEKYHSGESVRSANAVRAKYRSVNNDNNNK
ncbi:hypothetical protein HOC01_00885 [archaeon]|jgi:hypothetical protein|nr:hypothetical protein [archaeon]MBT6698603.1 hypothetical protein [archaeon]